jgi:hypothetical protein
MRVCRIPVAIDARYYDIDHTKTVRYLALLGLHVL